MIRGFYDLDAEDRDIIINVLEEYCVPYKVITVQRPGMFYEGIYEIRLDLEQKPWEFIRDKVNNTLEFYANLESNYELPAYEKDKKEPETHDVFEELFNPINIQNHTHANTEETKEITKKLFNDDERSNKTQSIGEILDDLMNKVPKGKVTKEDVKEFMQNSGLEKEIKDQLKKAICPDNEIKNKVMECLKSITESLDKGEIVKFDDLPLDLKDQLCSRFSEKELREGVIRKITTPNGIALSIEVKK